MPNPTVTPLGLLPRWRSALARYVLLFAILFATVVSGCSGESSEDALDSGSPGASGDPSNDPSDDPSNQSLGTATFLETFDGAPTDVAPYTSPNWDITRHNRDNDQLHQMTPMQADHGEQCGAAGDTHTVTDYEDLVYQCNNHVMTATYGKSQYGGYSMIYLTPNQILDTTGDFELSFDISTFQTNTARDWVDIWITPYDSNLQLTLDEWLPDLQGEPITSLHIRQQHERFWTTDSIENGSITRLPHSVDVQTDHVTPSKMQRTRHVLRVTGDRMQFGLPEHNLWWYDGPVPPVLRGMNGAVVQLGHHSYTPDKDCGTGLCGPNTYHWDNISLTPAMGFAMIHADRRLISSTTAPHGAQLSDATPQNAHLRFAGIGDSLEFSIDGGNTWQTPQLQQSLHGQARDHFKSYWTPVPAGITNIQFRGTNWYGGEWAVRDISVWAR